jgi:hypothetical protein
MHGRRSGTLAGKSCAKRFDARHDFNDVLFGHDIGRFVAQLVPEPPTSIEVARVLTPRRPRAGQLECFERREVVARATYSIARRRDHDRRERQRCLVRARKSRVSADALDAGVAQVAGGDGP